MHRNLHKNLIAKSFMVSPPPYHPNCKSHCY